MTLNLFDVNRWRTQGAWFGDPNLKAEVLARMIHHRERDEFIQGEYQSLLSAVGAHSEWVYKGCLIGCTLPYVADQGEDVSWHDRVQDEYGIWATVADLLDETFESLEEGFAEFAVASIEAIQPGADLTRVRAAVSLAAWEAESWHQEIVALPGASLITDALRRELETGEPVDFRRLRVALGDYFQLPTSASVGHNWRSVTNAQDRVRQALHYVAQESVAQAAAVLDALASAPLVAARV